MMSSKSTASTSSWLGLVVAVVGILLFVPALAHAGGRKRVVVLELEGPKAEKFHEDLVKLIKKSHTVVPVDKWNSTAEDLGASGTSEKNLKKVAKKLKIDAIITGKIDKRRDEYIIKLKLRMGKTGGLVGEGVDTKADGPRIDGRAAKDLKDELIDAIGNVDANRSGGGGDDEEDEEEDKPVKKAAKKTEDEDEDKPVKKGSSKKSEDEDEDEDKPVKKGFSKKSDEDEDKPVKKGFSKKSDDEDEEEDKPVKKGFSKKVVEDEEDKPVVKKKPAKKTDDEEVAALKSKKDDEEDEDPLPESKKKPAASKDDEDEDEDAPKKKVASKDDEDEDGGSVAEDSGDEDAAPVSVLSAGERAIDAVVGLSFNARRMSFTTEAGLAMGPPPYKGVPVAGFLVDATIYPLAIGHKKKGMAKNFGATVLFDKVLKISSKAGNPPVSLPTSQSRYAIGAVFRYPLGKLTAGATLRFGRQAFTIKPSGGVMPDSPNVNYTIVDPSLFMRYQIAPKFLFNLNLGFMLMLDTGQIQNGDQYGPATVTGFEGEIGGDYLLTKNIFARAAFKFETIGFKFRGGATKTNTKYDLDNGQDVFGARDSYLGGAVTVGYLY